jgi:hypothetical protein
LSSPIPGYFRSSKNDGMEGCSVSMNDLTMIEHLKYELDLCLVLFIMG